MVTAERSVDESGKAVFIPLHDSWCCESCYCTWFDNHAYRVHVLAVPPKSSNVVILLRDLLLLVFNGVLLHDIGGAFHFPGNPVPGMFMELQLGFGALGDPDPGFSESDMGSRVSCGAEEDVKMGSTPSGLKFQDPEVGDVRQHTAEHSQPSAEMVFDLAAIGWPGFMVRQTELTLDQVAGIVADVAEVRPGFVREFEDGGPCSFGHIGRGDGWKTAAEVHVPVKYFVPGRRGGGD